jgi:hypothetical protein
MAVQADMTAHSILASASPGHVATDPFPHLVEKDVLAADRYRRLQALFPATETILGTRRKIIENAAARMPAVKVLDNPDIALEWREFFAIHTSQIFWADIVRVFGTSLRSTFPKLEEQLGRGLEDLRVGVRGTDGQADLRLECQFVINTPGAGTSSVKTPHVDKRQTIFAALYYLRDPEDESEGGDLEFYVWKRAPRFLSYRMILPDDVEPNCFVPYAPNTLACFVNSVRSVHGVSARGPSDKPRRYINFIAELPFKAFATPPMSLPARVMHWRQVRQISRRSLGGDRY